MTKKRIEIDLLAIVILTFVFILIVFTGNISWLRVVLGFPTLILFPGYLLIGVLYPRKDILSLINRIALSLGLSIVIVVFIGLILNYLPWGIKLLPLSLSISIFILSLSIITWYVRGRYYPDERHNVGFKSVRLDFTNSFKPPTKVHLSLFILIPCAIIAVAGGYGYMMADSSEKQPFTEFYILGIENRADSYPLELKLGERGEVTVGIVNREYEATNYRIEVVVEDNKTYELFPIVLAPEEKWHGELEFIPEPVVKRQKVELLSITSNAEELIESAGRTSYLSFDKKAEGTERDFIKMLLERGHLSVLEHAYATFRLSGISRALTHQLVRHRLCSYTQQSQRFVDERNFNYIEPETIKNNPKSHSLFLEIMDEAKRAYADLQKMGIKNEDARFVLPNAIETQIVVTANLREWRHIIELRGSTDAQWEIREVTIEILKILKKHAPTVFEDFEIDEDNRLIERKVG